LGVRDCAPVPRSSHLCVALIMPTLDLKLHVCRTCL